MDRAPRTRKWKSLRIIIRLVAALIVLLVWTHDYWQPWINYWQCSRIAAQLSHKYGLVVRYDNPSEFYIPPQPAIDYKKNKMEIERVSPDSCLTALKGLRDGLNRYPHALISKYLSAIFISGLLKNNGIPGAGTYAYSWIFVSAMPVFDRLGSQYYAETLHHEFSSLIINNTNFPITGWSDQNDPDFNYLDTHMEVLQASAPDSRRDPKEASLWYEAGFVHDYGMASLENDFNTYAELAMTHPEQLRKLANQYPRIKAKTRIFVQFYSDLAPQLQPYFRKAGLIFNKTK